MINVRATEEIAILRQCGRINAQVHQEVRKLLEPGVTSQELDVKAGQVMRELGAASSMIEQYDFPGHICVSVNDQAGHGIPGKYTIRDGDTVKIDVSVVYEGYHTDCAITYVVGQASRDAIRLVNVTRHALWAGISCATAGRRCSDISSAIHQVVRQNGLAVIRHAFGHGVGRDLHESPSIANFGPANRGPRLRPGIVLAIEPVTSAGSSCTHRLNDEWTDATIDGSLSAHFEHTVLITDAKPEILTQSTDELHQDSLQSERSDIAYREIKDNEQSRLFELAATEMDPILIDAWGRRADIEEIFGSDGEVIVLEQRETGAILGFMVISQMNHFTHLNTIVIDRRYQGKGIGKQAMRKLEEITRDRQLRGIRLCVQANNQRATAFYRKLGFDVIGRPYVNTLLMRKTL